MRSSLATGLRAALAVSLIAGCSTSQQSTSTLPGSAGGTQSVFSQQAMSRDSLKGPLTPMKMLKLQAEGKLAGPVPRAASEKALKYLEAHRNPKFDVRREAGPSKLWVSNTDFSYLLGQNGSGSQTVQAVNTADDGCYAPITVKTDSNGNIFTACEANTSGYGSQEQEYNSSGSASASYAWTPPSSACPPSATGCFAEQYDGGPDGLGHVYAEMSLNQYYTCSGYSCYYYVGTPGFYWFDENSPSSTPTLIPVPGSGSLVVYYVYYMATDSSGNIWFDYTGCEGSSSCGAGLAEITNPTTAPAFVPIFPPTTYGFPGGVTIHGSTLSVTDQVTRSTYQYHLPVTPYSTPFQTLGPTATGISGNGDPVTGNYNGSGSQLIQGDGYGWLDITKTHTNGQKAKVNLDDLPGLEGAAFVPR